MNINPKKAAIAAGNTAIEKMTGPIVKSMIDSLPSHWKELLQKLHAPTLLDVVGTIANASLQDKGEVLGMVSNFIGEATAETGKALEGNTTNSSSSLDATEDPLAEIIKIIYGTTDNNRVRKMMMDNLTELEKDRDAEKIRKHLCFLGSIGISQILQGNNDDIRKAWADKISKKKMPKLGIFGLVKKVGEDLDKLDAETFDPATGNIRNDTDAGRFMNGLENFTQYLERKAGLRP